MSFKHPLYALFSVFETFPKHWPQYQGHLQYSILWDLSINLPLELRIIQLIIGPTVSPIERSHISYILCRSAFNLGTPHILVHFPRVLLKYVNDVMYSHSEIHKHLLKSGSGDCKTIHLATYHIHLKTTSYFIAYTCDSLQFLHTMRCPHVHP